MLSWVAQHVVLVSLAILFVAPIVFVVLTSLMSNDQALTASLIPRTWEWGNYLDVFTTVPLRALVRQLGALRRARDRVHARLLACRPRTCWPRSGSAAPTRMFLAIIVAMLLPPQVTAVPLYVMWTELGLTGSLWPLILPNLLGDAFSIFLLRQFFLTIPKEYADAARIDGCGEWGVLLRVMVPMAGPASPRPASSCSSTPGTTTSARCCTPRRTRWPGRSPTGWRPSAVSHGTDWSTTMTMTCSSSCRSSFSSSSPRRRFVEGITLTGVKG